MRNRADLLTTRVTQAIKLQPMTVKQIGEILCASDESVRQALRALEFKRRVRRAGFAAKPQTGVTPYLWVAA